MKYVLTLLSFFFFNSFFFLFFSTSWLICGISPIWLPVIYQRACELKQLLLSFQIGSKNFLSGRCWSTLEYTLVVNGVKAWLLARFVASLEDTLFCLLLCSCVCLAECASPNNPKCWHLTFLQSHGTHISDSVGWMMCVEAEWVRWDSLKPKMDRTKKVRHRQVQVQIRTLVPSKTDFVSITTAFFLSKLSIIPKEGCIFFRIISVLSWIFLLFFFL